MIGANYQSTTIETTKQKKKKKQDKADLDY